ncbi:MAG: hypothetical protein WDN23_19560 [Edaphobacter sp.]
MVEVASLVFHCSEDIGRILAKDGIEGDEGLKDDAPFILIEAAHAVERGGEWRLLDGRKVACAEGLFGAIEDVFELGELESLREDGDLFEEERIALLGLVDVGGEGFGRPDALRGGEIAFGEVDDAREFLVAIDADVRKCGKGGGGLITVEEWGLEHAGALEELKLRSEFAGGRGLAAGSEDGGEALLEASEALGEAICRGTGDCLPVPAQLVGMSAEIRIGDRGPFGQASGGDVQGRSGWREHGFCGGEVFRWCHEIFLVRMR